MVTATFKANQKRLESLEATLKKTLRNVLKTEKNFGGFNINASMYFTTLDTIADAHERVMLPHADLYLKALGADQFTSDNYQDGCIMMVETVGFPALGVIELARKIKQFKGFDKTVCDGTQRIESTIDTLDALKRAARPLFHVTTQVTGAYQEASKKMWALTAPHFNSQVTNYRIV